MIDLTLLDMMLERDVRDDLRYIACTPQMSDADQQPMRDRAKGLSGEITSIQKAPQRCYKKAAGCQTFAGARS